jgi:hypothetical protein
MTAANQDQSPPEATPQASEPGSAHGSVNIQALADRVYKLMLREIRLEKARGDEARRR